MGKNKSLWAAAIMARQRALGSSLTTQRTSSDISVEWCLNDQVYLNVLTVVIDNPNPKPDEVESIVMKSLDQICPSSKGWTAHAVVVTRIPDRLLAELSC